MKITEIFKSIEGETSYVGLPCAFIRVTGCNLRCSYCDTTYAYEGGREMSIPSILEEVRGFKTKLVCITGGEPLINKETPLLAEELLKKRYTVLVETNGACDIRALPKAAIKIMDLKCPDSNASPFMHWQNIAYLTPQDEVKFVLSSRNDYEWAKVIIRQHRLTDIARVLIGTASGSIPPKTVVQWLLEDNLNVRFQLQIHKYIWEPQARGV